MLANFFRFRAGQPGLQIQSLRVRRLSERHGPRSLVSILSLRLGISNLGLVQFNEIVCVIAGVNPARLAIRNNTVSGNVLELVKENVSRTNANGLPPKQRRRNMRGIESHQTQFAWNLCHMFDVIQRRKTTASGQCRCHQPVELRRIRYGRVNHDHNLGGWLS